MSSFTFRDVSPRTAQITLDTSPPGLVLLLDGQPFATPYSFTGVTGIERSLEAVSPQTSGATSWQFESWSNGGARAQTVSTPGVNTTFTASYAAPDPPTFTAKVNFQPATAPPVAAYLVDSGAVYGARANGYTYGWNADNSAIAYDRNAKISLDQRYDTFIQMQHFTNPNGSWEIAVPSGGYRVRIVAGDAKAHNSVYGITAEGVLIASGTPSAANRWVEGTQTVTVADGRLTIANAVGSSRNKICFLEITSLG
jgi:hypothetical protein